MTLQQYHCSDVVADVQKALIDQRQARPAPLGSGCNGKGRSAATNRYLNGGKLAGKCTSVIRAFIKEYPASTIEERVLLLQIFRLGHPYFLGSTAQQGSGSSNDRTGTTEPLMPPTIQPCH